MTTISKDIFRLLVAKYFDAETLYMCQFVSSWTRECILGNNDILKKARFARIVNRVRKQHEKEFEEEKKEQVKWFVRLATVGRKERKQLAMELKNTLYCCPRCHCFFPNKDKHAICGAAWVYDEFCKYCGCQYYRSIRLHGGSLNQSCAHYKLCPRQNVTCDTMIYLKLGCVPGEYVLPCDFVGCFPEVDHHITYDCNRFCANCKDPIKPEYLKNHLFKCYGSKNLHVGSTYQRFYDLDKYDAKSYCWAQKK